MHADAPITPTGPCIKAHKGVCVLSPLDQRTELHAGDRTRSSCQERLQLLTDCRAIYRTTRSNHPWFIGAQRRGLAGCPDRNPASSCIHPRARNNVYASSLVAASPSVRAPPFGGTLPRGLRRAPEHHGDAMARGAVSKSVVRLPISLSTSNTNWMLAWNPPRQSFLRTWR